MLPMMAALPLMVAWCRAEGVPPQAMVLLHFAAMFVPALLGRASRTGRRARCRSSARACCWPAPRWSRGPPRPDWLGLAVAHGAAWGLAWAGQLWAPARRSRQGASPLRAATGYAVLTLAFGLVVDEAGPRGVAAVHAALGLAATSAWLYRGAAAWRSRSGLRSRLRTPPP